MRDRILKLRKEGFSYNEISNELGCARSTVSYHCSKSGLGDIGLRSNPKLRVDPELKSLVEFMLYDLRIRVLEIADALSVTESQVNSIRRNSSRVRSDQDYSHGTYFAVKNRRKNMRLLGVLMLGGECVKCKYSKNIHSLDFHHKDPEEKEFQIGNKSNSKWETLKPEILKCELLCRNCHGEEHCSNTEAHNSFLENFIKYKKHV